MQIYEIPLSADVQTFKISFSGTIYQLTLIYRGPAGWVLDIADDSENPIVTGIPLVTGVDLLGQYKHLGFEGRMWVQGAEDPDDTPTYADLGTGSRLFWVTD
ncbi:bacteriophage protein [Burkholderia contaminans FFH2055]|uniref:phage baseplate plug family protein n=1 Tax=Burkholderia contaminans TaxID=488447 RepID=UPI0006250E6F|nr:hypothetical protein [Burkholderia contaminans]KKL38621.1 bacteriophage protein [Burkholderia contaminans FFH2055]MEB4631169.1 hypothetical protein [Burkholderia contaminans]MEB4637983.1 hypothetical protein [Burkholderia contaminans]MEB4653067.1 hypothetical protein [Burkholderia contaminans]MEB4658103.1 hypothetical protein [Burkholderia contaminans]